MVEAGKRGDQKIDFDEPATAVWYEIYYVPPNGQGSDAVAAAALGIYTVDTYMVLSKLILEKYLNNRFVARSWQAWYDRMVEAGKRGEDMSHRPYLPTGSSSHRSIASPKL